MACILVGWRGDLGADHLGGVAVIASDIPGGYRHSTDMARVLVTYIDCDERVQRECFAHFDTAPSLFAIRDLRGIHERSLKKRLIPPFGPHEGYCRAKEAATLDKVNARFVLALKTERNRSNNARELAQMARARGIGA